MGLGNVLPQIVWMSNPAMHSEEFDDRVAFSFGLFVVALFLPARVHLRFRESGVRVDMERRERVGEPTRRQYREAWRLLVLKGSISSFLRRLHPTGRARVSTLAPKNGAVAVKTKSAGTKTDRGIVSDKPKSICLEIYGRPCGPVDESPRSFPWDPRAWSLQRRFRF